MSVEGWLTFDLYQYISIHSLFQRHHKPYIIFIPVGGWVGILEFSRCKRRWRKFCVNKSANVCNINTAELYINICPWHQFRQEKPFAIEGNKRACKHTLTHTHKHTQTTLLQNLLNLQWAISLQNKDAIFLSNVFKSAVLIITKLQISPLWFYFPFSFSLKKYKDLHHAHSLIASCPL